MFTGNSSKFIKSVLFVLAWFFRIFLNGVAFFGIALILYEVLATRYNSRWPLLDSNATYISTLLTLFGAFCTAVSIYFYSERMTPPEKISMFITAPLVACACIMAVFLFFWSGGLPLNVVNGFALLAISGALLRIQPHPVKDNDLFWNRKKPCGG
jgi:hypothetical protein